MNANTMRKEKEVILRANKVKSVRRASEGGAVAIQVAIVAPRATLHVRNVLIV